MQGLAISQVVVSEDFEGVTSLDETSLVSTYLGSVVALAPGVSLDFSGGIGNCLLYTSDAADE